LSNGLREKRVFFQLHYGNGEPLLRAVQPKQYQGRLPNRCGREARHLKDPPLAVSYYIFDF
jgi:hypothetical protein